MFPSTRAGIGPVFELLLQCEHGTTLRYERSDGGKFIAVLKEAAQTQNDWSVASYAKGIRAFARIFSESLRDHPGVERCYPGVAPILIEKLQDADPEITHVLGDLLYCGDQEESHLRPCAPPFGSLQALRYLVSSSSTRGEMTQWFEGSYARSSLGGKLVLRLDPRRMACQLASSFVSREMLVEQVRCLRMRLRLLQSRFRKGG